MVRHNAIKRYPLRKGGVHTTKSQVIKSLDEAIKSYNDEMEGYIINCDESEKANLRKIVSGTMECFSDFKDVIAKLADE